MPVDVIFKLNMTDCVFQTLDINFSHSYIFLKYNVNISPPRDGICVLSSFNLSGAVTTAEMRLCDF